jgi:hypothetical protein
MATETGEEVPGSEGNYLPLSELRTHGLLWLINRVVFHPRGFALGLQRDDDSGEIIGWEMLGDGTEPWQFGSLEDGTLIDDDQFAKAEAFLHSLRPAESQAPTPFARGGGE